MPPRSSAKYSALTCSSYSDERDCKGTTRGLEAVTPILSGLIQTDITLIAHFNTSSKPVSRSEIMALSH